MLQKALMGKWLIAFKHRNGSFPYPEEHTSKHPRAISIDVTVKLLFTEYVC